MVEKLRGPKGEPITVSLLNGHLNLCLSTHRLVLFSDLIRDGCTVDGGHSETQPSQSKENNCWWSAPPQTGHLDPSPPQDPETIMEDIVERL